MASVDGICEECGNTGIVGELCSFCGSRIEPLDKDLERFEDPEALPVVSKARRAKVGDDNFDPDADDPDLDDEMDELEEDLDEIENMDGASAKQAPSLEQMADEENERENKDAWFDADNFNVDEEEA